MLKCIIYTFEQTIGNVPTIKADNYILKKGFIKYDKCNGVIPMKTHIEFWHPKLFDGNKL